MKENKTKLNECKDEIQEILDKYNCILTAQILLGEGYSKAIVKILEKEESQEQKEE